MSRRVTVWLSDGECDMLQQIMELYNQRSMSGTLATLLVRSAGQMGIYPHPRPAPQGQMTIFDTLTVDGGSVQLEDK